jgi:hypothetical protein
MIITRESHDEYMKEYRKFMDKTKKVMDLIVNQHRKIGIPSIYDWKEYYPCEYIETIDEEYGLIKIYEPSIKSYHTVYATSLVII